MFKTFHCLFCFCYKENMFNLTLIESDCPVRRLVTHRCGNLESSRKLFVNIYFFGYFQILGKFSLNTFFAITVNKHIILNCFLYKERLVKALCFFGGKDSAVEFSFDAYCRYLSLSGNEKAPYFYDAFPSPGNLCI